jgi:hypothetical protein
LGKEHETDRERGNILIFSAPNQMEAASKVVTHIVLFLRKGVPFSVYIISFLSMRVPFSGSI